MRCFARRVLLDVMFSARVKFEAGNGTKYSADNVKATYGRIDTATTPGYFTEK